MLKLREWLKKNNIKMYEFAQMMQCHRQTLSKIDNNIAIDEVLARKITFATGGKVNVLSKPRGRPTL